MQFDEDEEEVCISWHNLGQFLAYFNWGKFNFDLSKALTVKFTVLCYSMCAVLPTFSIL